MRPQIKAPRLPQEILDQISDSSHPRKTRGQVSRKESRKEKRRTQKQRKAEYFSVSTSAARGTGPGKRKRPSEDGEVRNSSPKRKKWDPAPAPDDLISASLSRSPEQFNSSKLSSVVPSMIPNRPKEKPKSALQKLAEKSSRPASGVSSRPRTQREKEEDEYIAKLEAKLARGMGDGKQDEDGLDDLLQFISGVGLPDQLVDHSQTEESDPESDSSIDPGSNDDEEEWKGCQITALDVVETTEAEPQAEPESSSTTPHAHERPPTAFTQAPSEVQLKINRSLKGLLNRMSEANIGTIVEGVEELYGKFSRHDLTSTLSTLLLTTIASAAAHLESYVLLHATFIASLGRVSGIGDFVPYFVREAVEMYERHRLSSASPVTDADNESPIQEQQNILTSQGKQAANILTLLSSLYNLQIISCVLTFDLIRELLETTVGTDEESSDKGFSEMDVELILVVIRCSGPQMRSDDPSALKDIVKLVQEKIAIIPPESLGSRTKFMVETLVNLKNNKLKRSGPGAQSQGVVAETLERMKKFLVGFSKKRQIGAPEPLRLTLSDLRSAESKGKWWLIGAAWGGDPLVDRQRAAQDKQNINHDQKRIQTGDDEDDVQALMELSRKQGMNTDIRRSVFVVLMQSDDYVDACERLAGLNLTEVQQREIVRVALHCCGNEKQYNPYYALVCQHLCRTSYSHKVTLQFWLWDFLRDLGESKVGGVEVIKNLKQDEGGFELKSVSPTRLRNVARAYGWWIAKDCVGLSILKPVDFLTLKSHTQSFLKELLTQVFLSTQLSTPLANESVPPTRRNESAVREVFVKATRVEALAMGLAYFIGETFRSEQDTEIAQLIKWAAGIARGTLQVDVEI